MSSFNRYVPAIISSSNKKKQSMGHEEYVRKTKQEAIKESHLPKELDGLFSESKTPKSHEGKVREYAKGEMKKNKIKEIGSFMDSFMDWAGKNYYTWDPTIKKWRIGLGEWRTNKQIVDLFFKSLKK